MKKKLKRMLPTVFVSMFLLIGCTACSVGEKSTNPDVNEEQLTQSKDESALQIDGNLNQSQKQENAVSLLDGADLVGTVVDFSADGFILSPASVSKDKSGGEVMQEAAPGSEDKDNLIVISYSSNTTFEIVTLDSASLTEVSREETKKSSVKKQSSLLIYGNCQDTLHWTADKVILIQWKK